MHKGNKDVVCTLLWHYMFMWICMCVHNHTYVGKIFQLFNTYQFTTMHISIESELEICDQTQWCIPSQVSFVQYSDEAKSEFKLNTFDDKAQALGALQNVQYRGGNTRTGNSEQ